MKISNFLLKFCIIFGVIQAIFVILWGGNGRITLLVIVLVLSFVFSFVNSYQRQAFAKELRRMSEPERESFFASYAERTKEFANLLENGEESWFWRGLVEFTKDMAVIVGMALALLIPPAVLMFLQEGRVSLNGSLSVVHIALMLLGALGYVKLISWFESRRVAGR